MHRGEVCVLGGGRGAGGWQWFRMIQAHCFYCVLYFYFYYISSSSDQQALDTRGWEPLVEWMTALTCLKQVPGEKSTYCSYLRTVHSDSLTLLLGGRGKIASYMGNYKLHKMGSLVTRETSKQRCMHLMAPLVRTIPSWVLGYSPE